MKSVILGGFIVIWASNWERLSTFEMSPWPSWGDSHCLPDRAYHVLKSFQPPFHVFCWLLTLAFFCRPATLAGVDGCPPLSSCLSVLSLVTSYVQFIVYHGPFPILSMGSQLLSHCFEIIGLSFYLWKEVTLTLDNGLCNIFVNSVRVFLHLCLSERLEYNFLVYCDVLFVVGTRVIIPVFWNSFLFSGIVWEALILVLWRSGRIQK